LVTTFAGIRLITINAIRIRDIIVVITIVVIAIIDMTATIGARHMVVAGRIIREIDRGIRMAGLVAVIRVVAQSVRWRVKVNIRRGVV
jgi:hypothetical protein